MYPSLRKAFIVLLCLGCFGTGHFNVFARSAVADSDAPAPAKTRFATIVVNGRSLTGPNSNAHRIDGRILLPLAALTRALGDTFSISVAARTVTVRRQTGMTADFDARIGQVRENGAVVLVVSNAAEIAFSPNPDEFLLPVEICSVLLDVSIRYDEPTNTVIVDHGRAATSPARMGSSRGVADLYQLDYEYNVNRYSTAMSRNVVLNGAGRIGDGRFYFSTNSSASPARPLTFGNSIFRLERPNGQRFVAGDFGSGTDLQFLSASVRGGLAAIPVGRFLLTAFAGRASSGSVLSAVDPQIPPDPLAAVAPPINARYRIRYDVTTFGAYVTSSSPAAGSRPFPAVFSAGAMRFSGADRSGSVVSGSVNYGGSRVRLQGELAYGDFAGFRSDGTRFSGPDSAVDLSGTFQAAANLAVQARFTHIGERFLSPQSGVREPLDLKAAGVTWSPAKWLSASFNASTARRPGVDSQNNSFVTGAVTLSPRSWFPKVYISHTESKTSQIRSSSFTMLNVSKDFSRLRFFLNATRIKTLGPASLNAQIGANFTINERNSLEFNQGIGSRGTLNGQFDWRTSGLMNNRLSFAAGIGYSHSANSGTSPYERLSASLTLPRQTAIQFSYYQTNAGPTLLASIKGSLFRRREATAFLNAPTESMNSFANASGRIYLDVDLDGHYDPDVDQPLADVKVRVDGNRYVVSDAQGLYRVDSVIAGDHKVYLDLLSVRADLTLLDSPERNTLLAAGRDTVMDFRLVRTGRISGRVWLDSNGNGKFDEGERPLADVRVVTGSGRDTLTDADGYFVIGDLPPGEHVVLIDAKTLPEKTMPQQTPLAVNVSPGSETVDVSLAAIDVPAEVKRFPARIKE